MKYISTILLITILSLSCNKEGDLKPLLNKIKETCFHNLPTPTAERRYPIKGKPPKDNTPTTSQNAVIFLDFDGHTVRGTPWNINGDIVCGHSGLSTSQQEDALNIAKSHYAPFNVIVTADSSLYWKGNPNKRMRVVVTQNHEWYGGGVGGVAYTNSMTWGDNTPCFVFSRALSYNIKNIGEVSAHESGHTTGLRHQSDCVEGVKTNEYSYGTIMGQCMVSFQITWRISGTTPYCGIQRDLDHLNTFFN